ncbi:NAD(P)H-dependent oxidoreductase [Yeosuana sp. MJ-SS3]|jgi:multimeric flavodoxin WrbA|uniref:NAD(P)H-dependent oxidoreductase n=1 Tax=Gilvirhabdus luticola TaxID=3079858 RepID=A0ABU3U885_9FLAO|nr:NAD(P)H-dependent oxidoreductase [Yeosuana sp. MJ-SS3]MDU8886529.1 NAD(P)H-dependent oxidoreductase [Yeosuana sp. MJ-SS3]
MKNKTVIVIGSSRSNGNTRRVVDQLISLSSDIDIIDLNSYNIGFYDYDFKNRNDDFFPLFLKILEYDTIIFATPIYWYTMSAQIKTFLDRISDVLHEDKKVFGRKLRGKNLATISCGSDNEIFDGFTMPFEQTSNYLGMNYLGHLHTWLDNNSELPDIVKNKLKEFSTYL